MEAPMAILTIKDVPDLLYERLKQQARAEGRSVSREVIRLLEAAVGPSEPNSILDLAGLGSDLWRGDDAARHVEAERAAWD
jgi:plasmid stability protein